MVRKPENMDLPGLQVKRHTADMGKALQCLVRQERCVDLNRLLAALRRQLVDSRRREGCACGKAEEADLAPRPFNMYTAPRLLLQPGDHSMIGILQRTSSHHLSPYCSTDRFPWAAQVCQLLANRLDRRFCSANPEQLAGAIQPHGCLAAVLDVPKPPPTSAAERAEEVIVQRNLDDAIAWIAAAIGPSAPRLEVMVEHSEGLRLDAARRRRHIATAGGSCRSARSK
mmetsp:Transcript_98095/g.282984  ORF Transcript_98095/g.282984 Transcript_98095/m.282984 type:complete len:227 (-) Transcript_98095:25-705(-)